MSDQADDLNAMNRRVAEWMGYSFIEDSAALWRIHDPKGRPFGRWESSESACWDWYGRLWGFDRDGYAGEIREFLRRNMFLVELKILPDGYLWRDNHEPSEPVSTKRAYCRCYPVGDCDVKPSNPLFYRIHGFGDTETEAVLRAADLAREAFSNKTGAEERSMQNGM